MSKNENAVALERVIEHVWERYTSNMQRGFMQQRPGRTEYQIELQNAGLLEKGRDAARQFFFDFFNPQNEIRKAILKVEKRWKQKIKTQSH